MPKPLRHLIAVLLLLWGAAAHPQPIEVHRLDGPVAGAVLLERLAGTGLRVTLDLRVEAPTLWADLDALGAARGNLGSCEHRLYLLGPTRLRAVEGPTVRLSTRARYEAWACRKLLGREVRHRVLADTQRLDLSLTPIWRDGLRLRIALDGMGRMPDWLPAILDRAGLDLAHTVRLDLGEAEDLLKDADAALSNLRAEALPDGLALSGTLEASRAAVFAALGARLFR